MKTAIFNAIMALIGLILIGLGWYSIGYGFGENTGNPNLYFFGGFLMFGTGIGIIIYIAVNAKN